MILTATIEGRCVPWMRAGGRGRQRYTPAEQREYQRYVRAVVASARPRRWPLDMRYALELVVYEPDARRRDLDNQAKTILDALNGTAWADDSSVDVLALSRRIDRERPRVEVTIAAMSLIERDAAQIDVTIGNAPCLTARSIVASDVDASRHGAGSKRPRGVGAPGVRTEPGKVARCE